MENDKDTLVLYHGDCPDGFGSAYAAWKKFGDNATYIPLLRGEEAPVERTRGKEAFFVDFCYEQEVMDRFLETAKHVVMLDHHAGVKEVIESIPEHRYGTDKSGSGLAWEYFHPDTPMPALLQYVQEYDLYRFALPYSNEIISYVHLFEYDFSIWDDLATQLESAEGKAKIVQKGEIFLEHTTLLVQQIVKSAKLVEFEGYTCYFASCSRQFKDRVGNALYKKLPPFALVVSASPEKINVSIRSDGTVDVAKIAQKYGGNGHTAAAGFRILLKDPMPWKKIEKDETPSD